MIAILPGGGGGVSNITQAAVVAAGGVSKIGVSKIGLQFCVDNGLRCDGHGYVLDDGNGVRLWHLDSVRGWNWHFNGNAVGHWYRTVYWNGNVLGDLNWVGFGHVNGIRTVDRHGVWHLEEKDKE